MAFLLHGDCPSWTSSVLPSSFWQIIPFLLPSLRSRAHSSPPTILSGFPPLAPRGLTIFLCHTFPISPFFLASFGHSTSSSPPRIRPFSSRTSSRLVAFGRRSLTPCIFFLGPSLGHVLGHPTQWLPPPNAFCWPRTGGGSVGV